MMIPVLGFAAFSGTGKTTMIEKLIPELNNHGVKVAVIKHDAHGLKFDKDGKDSQRFANAGAVMSWVNGPEAGVAFLEKSFSIEESIDMIRRTADITGVNLILVEGYKTGNIDKVGMCREATGKGFTDDVSKFVAVVTDCTITGSACCGEPTSTCSLENTCTVRACCTENTGTCSSELASTTRSDSTCGAETINICYAEPTCTNSTSCIEATSTDGTAIFGFDEIDKLADWIIKNYIIKLGDKNAEHE